jgi:hypothetical protein
MFRLWIVFSTLFVLGVGAASYNTIREEFRASGKAIDLRGFRVGDTTYKFPASYSDEKVKDILTKQGIIGTPGSGAIAERLLPVECGKARGVSATDYSLDEGSCWYTTAIFRRLYPEYKELNEHDLSEKLYAAVAGRSKDVKRLLADPDFQKLDLATQKPTLGKLDPRFSALSDGDYLKFLAGMDAATKPRPWLKVAESAALAFGVPLAVLAFGCALIWAISGFHGSIGHGTPAGK